MTTRSGSTGQVQRPWYRRKGCLIPLGLLALFLCIGGSLFVNAISSRNTGCQNCGTSTSVQGSTPTVSNTNGEQSCSAAQSDNTIVQTIKSGQAILVGINNASQQESTTLFSSADAVASYKQKYPNWIQQLNWHTAPHFLAWSLQSLSTGTFMIAFQGDLPFCKVVPATAVNAEIQKYVGNGQGQFNDPSPTNTTDGTPCDQDTNCS